MRKSNLYAQAIHVFIQNSPHDQAAYYAPSLTIALPSPTDCTIKITNVALWLLKQLYKPGIYYLKAGVMLMDLVPQGGQQRDLLGFSDDDVRSTKLMATMDELNKKFGRGTIKLASEGVNKTWAMRRDHKSPNYIGDWNELPIVGQNMIFR